MFPSRSLSNSTKGFTSMAKQLGFANHTNVDESTDPALTEAMASRRPDTEPDEYPALTDYAGTIIQTETSFTRDSDSFTYQLRVPTSPSRVAGAPSRSAEVGVIAANPSIFSRRSNGSLEIHARGSGCVQTNVPHHWTCHCYASPFARVRLCEGSHVTLGSNFRTDQDSIIIHGLNLEPYTETMRTAALRASIAQCGVGR
ncbi:hypothetical protein IAT40_000658 [Kwoniella sp. CBS 6097]